VRASNIIHPIGTLRCAVAGIAMTSAKAARSFQVSFSSQFATDLCMKITRTRIGDEFSNIYAINKKLRICLAVKASSRSRTFPDSPH
jgi:hypothetical protein